MSEKKDKPLKPSVVRDANSAGFFDGTAQGKLMLQYCKNCRKYSFIDGKYCQHCQAEVVWKEVSGNGTVHSWSVNHQILHPSFTDDVPYIIGLVKLAEGPIIRTRLVDLKSEELHLDLPVHVRFEKNTSSGEMIPVFGPV